jgi:hypothetical protein
LGGCRLDRQPTVTVIFFNFFFKMFAKYFTPITAEEKQRQDSRLAEEASTSAAAAAADNLRAAACKPPLGRRPKEKDVNDVLVAPKEDDSDEPAAKRNKYKDWFGSDAIHHILSVHRQWHFSSHKTVQSLRAVSDFYADLSRSTIDSWFDKDHKLLPQYQHRLDDRSALRREATQVKAFAEFPEAEQRIKQILTTMRENGGQVSTHVTQAVMKHVIREGCPHLLESLKLSNSFIVRWLHTEMNYTWRRRTTAAAKLPLDWQQQGINMAKRIAANIQTYDIHFSLIVNMDQTGIHLVPCSAHTYDLKGSKGVPMLGHDDKRQITACVAASMTGELLPLQLIFQGKTQKCEPRPTAESNAAGFHLTHSENHWSTQTTMQDWVRQILIPYANLQKKHHTLQADSKILLILDVWAVHKSEEFRRFLRTEFPDILLVFVPANCTSKLQLADLMLQRPFKHGVRTKFNEWATTKISEQISSNTIVGLTPFLKMESIKPMVLQWCLDSWKKMKDGKEYIMFGWNTCVFSLYDVRNKEKRQAASQECYEGNLEVRGFIPEGEEEAEEKEQSESESDEEKDILDVMKERRYGSRKSDRKRKEIDRFGYQIPSAQVSFTHTASEDSDANGMD